MKNSVTFLILFLALSAGAQSFDKQKMDSLFNIIEKNNRGMGAFAIHKEGEQVYRTNIGYADIANNIKANSQTKYRIGSISKTFTAAMILQLVEEGKLELDTKLSKFYPHIPNANRITIEDLLRHQSGLFNFTNDDAFKDYMEHPKSKEEILDIFRKQKPLFEPGQMNEYSNTNYVILTFILEDLEKEPYREVLKKRILEPLNLKNTNYGGKINSAGDEAFSYRKSSEWEPATETDMSIPMGAGALISTPSDLNKFYTALFKGKIIKLATLEKMKTLKNGYGMGLFSFPFDDKNFYGHTGGIDGFNAISAYNPVEDLAVSYISNGTDLSINDISIAAISVFYGLDSTLPSLGPAIEVPVEKLKTYTGTYGSDTFPLQVKIFIENGRLMGQATGQSSFPLEPYDEHKFQFVQAGLKLEFTPEGDKITLLQGGQSHELSRL